MLTPIELQGKGFKTGFGYDKKDVEAFLKEVIKDYEYLYKENLELNEKINVLSEGVQYYKSIEKTLQKALVLAEKAAQDTETAALAKAEAIEKEAIANATACNQEAVTKAEEMLSNARIEAKSIILEAQKDLDKLQVEISSLVQTYEKYKIQYKQFVAAQYELLESDAFQLDFSKFSTLTSDQTVEEATGSLEIEKEYIEPAELQEETMVIAAHDSNIPTEELVTDHIQIENVEPEMVTAKEIMETETMETEVTEIEVTEIEVSETEEKVETTVENPIDEIEELIEEQIPLNEITQEDTIQEVHNENLEAVTEDDDFIPIIDIKSILAEVEAQERERKQSEESLEDAEDSEEGKEEETPMVELKVEDVYSNSTENKESLEEMSERELLQKLFGKQSNKVLDVTSTDVDGDFEFLNI